MIRSSLRRLRQVEWDPLHALRVVVRTLLRALVRLWGRDVMLFTGGVSFFIMLAIFPALAILVSLYGLLAEPAQAAQTGEALSRLMPEGVRDILRNELLRLTTQSHTSMSAQSGLALLIGAYAAHRGFKALLAGLSFIHDEDKPRGFVGFNLLALLVLIATFSALGVVSALFLGIRVMGSAFDLKPLQGVPWLYSEWTWASAALSVGLACIYRFAMSSRPVDWRASVIGGIVAAALCLGASWAIAFYVEQVAHLGATYGSIATVVVFLIWLSWNVNAIFFGGALATEVELALEAAAIHNRAPLLNDLRNAKPLTWPPKR
jgi:membrane protein